MLDIQREKLDNVREQLCTLTNFMHIHVFVPAAQMWCLARFLPLMIGGLVPEDDEHWQLFQILLEIMDVVLSPETTEHAIGVLEGLIEEHHYRFVDLYPERSIIPKMHYMVHYPAHMYKWVGRNVFDSNLDQQLPIPATDSIFLHLNCECVMSCSVCWCPHHIHWYFFIQL